MEQKTAQRIQEIIQEVLNRATFQDFSIEVEMDRNTESDRCIFHIHTPTESRFLIGQHGDNIRALQHVIRLLVWKELGHLEEVFSLDVNEYYQQKERFIRESAQQGAQEALRDKKAVLLRPMTAYERRLVHTALAQNEDVITESTGEGEERKVVIKPSEI